MDVDTAEFQDVIGFGNGADPQDKGAGKAFTYSLKNALSKSFMLFSGEDTDSTHSDDIGKPETPKQASNPVSKGNVSEAQIKRLYAIAKAKGYTSESVNKSVKIKYSKSIDLLTKAEYDKLVSEMEKLEDKKA